MSVIKYGARLQHYRSSSERHVWQGTQIKVE